MAHISGKPGDKKLSFEEFKLYYESTEKVTDRRLRTNQWNYSVCVATLVAIAAILKWSLSAVILLWVGFAAVVILCVMAILFCILWVRQIRDFKKLNNAKFSVLNEMASDMVFDLDKPDAIVSYEPFEKEWTKLKELNAIQELGRSNIVALKSSNIEYFIPKAFTGLFGGILLVLILVIVFNWPLDKLVQVAREPAGGTNAPGQAK